MKLVFFSNYLNHHQVQIADGIYEILKKDFVFVATKPRDTKELKGGRDYSDRPYCLLAGEDEESHSVALKWAVSAEVCLFGAFSQEYAVERAKRNPKGLSFEIGERWLKRGWINVLSPSFRIWWLNYMRYYRYANFYKLCCSAYTAIDDMKLHAYKGKHYKWGYFTPVPELETSHGIDGSTADVVRIMWCARLLILKHPELPIQMSALLKSKGYRFVLEMYGGDENAAAHEKIYHHDRLQKLINDLGVNDCVKLMGNQPNAVVLEAMKRSDIFLFTSDKHEGWGAVSNESMANGCVLVVSDAVGSAPYLIEDGLTGYKFTCCNVDSLTEKVEILINDPDSMHQIKRRAYECMRDVWSPQNAVKNLVQLIDDLIHNRTCSIVKGPCSKA